MIINCFQLQSNRTLKTCSYEHAVAASKDLKSLAWVDAQGGETAELEHLLENFNIQHLARRLCLEARERPGFYPLHAGIFLVIPVQADETDSREVEYVSLLCLENLLLTFRSPRDSRLQRITTQQESPEWMQDESIAGLVAALMMLVSLESLQQLSDIRTSIVTLEEKMEDGPESVSTSEISEKRSKLLTLEAVVSGQLPSLQALMATDRPFFRLDATREYLISALANLQAADRSIRWLEGRMEVIRLEFEMRSQDKMNRRLGRLTILSLVFMPMTFLAGIWGMNFNFMPELNSPLGYPFALSSMLLMGFGMFFYFRRKGWFE